MISGCSSTWRLANGLAVVLTALLVASASAQTTSMERAHIVLGGTRLVISGTLGPGSAALTREMLAGRRIEEVELDSRDGLLAEGAEIAGLIRPHRPRTVVRGSCYAACTLVFMAGAERHLGLVGMVGFSRPAPDEEQAARSLLLSSGLPPRFVQRIMATPGMLVPSRSEVLRLGIVHGVRVSDAERERLSDSLTNFPVFQALQRAAPSEFDAFLRQSVARFEGGAEVESLRTWGAGEVDRLSRAFLPRAEDDLLAQHLDLVIDIYAFYGERSPETCAALEDPHRGARIRQPLNTASPALFARQQDLMARLILSGAGRPAPTPDEAAAAHALETARAATERGPGIEPEVFNRNVWTAADFPIACRTSLAFYRAVRTLPPTERVNLQRYLYVTPQ